MLDLMHAVTLEKKKGNSYAVTLKRAASRFAVNSSSSGVKGSGFVGAGRRPMLSTLSRCLGGGRAAFGSRRPFFSNHSGFQACCSTPALLSHQLLPRQLLLLLLSLIPAIFSVLTLMFKNGFLDPQILICKIVPATTEAKKLGH